jgi:hypothetical protein
MLCLAGSALADTRQRILDECQQILQTAVRRPYGIAWGATSGADEPRNPPPATVMLWPQHTPAAGLMLLWAGQALGDATLTQAAVQVARGIAAASESTGRIPSTASFGRTALGRDPPQLVPDRASTCAGLALLLSVIETSPKPDPLLRGAALRAAHWLVRQQTRTGLFVASHPPHAPPERSIRLVRLDRPDYRDAVLALILAYEVLEDAAMRIAAERAVEQLLKLRYQESKSARGLWHTAFDPDGTITRALPQFPRGVDMLATRYSMQALLAMHVSQGTQACKVALDQATERIATLPTQQGQWRRLYLMVRDEVVTLATTQPAGDPGSPPPFAPPDRAPDPASEMGSFGLDGVLEAWNRLSQTDRVKYAQRLAAMLTYRQQIAATLVGLSDRPLGDHLPTSPQDSRDWKPSTQPTAQTEAGTSLPAVTARIHALVLRLKAAKLSENPP